MPSLGAREMRHGRKSKSRAFTGYKRHVPKADDVIVAALVQPDREATGPKAIVPENRCRPCSMRADCTAARHGRPRSSVLHPQERLLVTLRYEAVRKNSLDSRRCAAVADLHVVRARIAA
jgi:hypothetical protein